MDPQFPPPDSAPKASEKECPRCHGTFFCDVQGGCWCGKLTLGEETLQQLRSEYIDCLCPTCLKQFEDHKN